MQYCIDELEACQLLVSAARRQLPVRLLLDGTQVKNPSCKRQPQRLAELTEWGVEIRSYKPPGGGFAAMHSKLIIVDREVLFTGSVNLTHHGLEKNEENLIVTSVSNAVASAVTRFEEVWALAQSLQTAPHERIGSIPTAQAATLAEGLD